MKYIYVNVFKSQIRLTNRNKSASYVKGGDGGGGCAAPDGGLGVGEGWEEWWG
jgi:hypothetical protein